MEKELSRKQSEEKKETKLSPNEEQIEVSEPSLHTGADFKNADKVLRNAAEEVVEVTEEESKRIARKTDLHVLTIIAWCYFLQCFDKYLLGYAGNLGLKTDAHLKGDEYSTLGSMNAFAQLAWQPFSSYVLVRVPPKWLLSIWVTCWGASLCGMAGSTNYAGLAASRFLLGLFESACLPLFAILTSIWYRRAEQPLRVCYWYAQNGTAGIVGSALSYGMAQIHHSPLFTYQRIFLLAGLVTVATGPVTFWLLPNDISEARFLNEDEKKKGIERLRANQTGASSQSAFKTDQAIEALWEPKTWLFMALVFFVNVGAAVATVFGPLIITGLGFNSEMATLLNMPFGFVQSVVVVVGSLAAYHVRFKSLVILILILPTVAGLAILYALPAGGSHNGPLLFGYYLFACTFGINPLLVSWISANTAGSTKKSVLMSLFNASVAGGNIAGPYLFKTQDAPRYLPGLRATLGMFIATFVVVILQTTYFIYLNNAKSRERVRNGKPAKLEDLSMKKKFETVTKEDIDKREAQKHELGENAIFDMTDRKNDEFIYVY